MSTTAEEIALRLIGDADAFMAGVYNGEEHSRRNQATWAEAEALGLLDEVDVLLEAHIKAGTEVPITSDLPSEDGY